MSQDPLHPDPVLRTVTALRPTGIQSCDGRSTGTRADVPNTTLTSEMAWWEHLGTLFAQITGPRGTRFSHHADAGGAHPDEALPEEGGCRSERQAPPKRKTAAPLRSESPRQGTGIGEHFLWYFLGPARAGLIFSVTGGPGVARWELTILQTTLCRPAPGHQDIVSFSHSNKALECKFLWLSTKPVKSIQPSK